MGNYCLAPLIGDTRTGKVHYMNSFYYLGHFSRFVRPGARRIGCSSSSDNLLTSAFINPNGSAAVIVQNQTEAPSDFQIWVGGKAAKSKLPPHSIVTVTIRP